MNTKQHTTKPKLKLIQTELNYYEIMKNSINRIAIQTNLNRLIVITLLVWNIFLTFQVNTINNKFEDLTLEQEQQLERLEVLPNLPELPY